MTMRIKDISNLQILEMTARVSLADNRALEHPATAELAASVQAGIKELLRLAERTELQEKAARGSRWAVAKLKRNRTNGK